MENTRACGHVLGGTVFDDATTTVVVLVLKGAIDHVGERLKATVGVP